VVNKNIGDASVVILGAGAAAIALARLLKRFGTQKLVLFDSKGKLCLDRDDLSADKAALACGSECSLEESLEGADVLITLASPGFYAGREAMLANMSDDAVVFLGENPTGAFDALAAAALENVSIVAIGNFGIPGMPVLNNAYGFPGIFRALADAPELEQGFDRKQREKMSVKAAQAIAGLVDELSLARGEIIPPIFTAAGYNTSILAAGAAARDAGGDPAAGPARRDSAAGAGRSRRASGGTDRPTPVARRPRDVRPSRPDAPVDC